MTFEGFEGSVDKKKGSITLTLTYDGKEPDNEQKERDFKVMLGYISLALTNLSKTSLEPTFNPAQER